MHSNHPGEANSSHLQTMNKTCDAIGQKCTVQNASAFHGRADVPLAVERSHGPNTGDKSDVAVVEEEGEE